MRPAGPIRSKRAGALTALEACLAYLADLTARYGEEPDWGLPDGFWEFWEYHPFGMDVGLRRSRPTLADITPEKVRAWVETDVDPELAFGRRGPRHPTTSSRPSVGCGCRRSSPARRTT